jgi:hypothetical protein
MRLRSHRIALILAVLLPMVVFSAIVVVVFGRQQRAAVERRRDRARPRERGGRTLKSSITTLEALATVHRLRAGRTPDGLARRPAGARTRTWRSC